MGFFRNFLSLLYILTKKLKIRKIDNFHVISVLKHFKLSYLEIHMHYFYLNTYIYYRKTKFNLILERNFLEAITAVLRKIHKYQDSRIMFRSILYPMYF